MVGKFAKLKMQDKDMEQVKMHRVKNLIVFEDQLSEENAKLAQDADLKIYHFNQLIKEG